MSLRIPLLYAFLFVTLRNVLDSSALMRACLAYWYRAFRRRQRRAGSRFAASAFHRFACMTMIAVMSAQSVLTSPEISRAAVEVVSAMAINYGQDAHFQWHSSGLAARYERLRNEYLPHIGFQAQKRGRDGRGAPAYSRPAPQEVETR